MDGANAPGLQPPAALRRQVECSRSRRDIAIYHRVRPSTLADGQREVPERGQIQTRNPAQVYVDPSRRSGDRAGGRDVVIERHQGRIRYEGASDR